MKINFKLAILVTASLLFAGCAAPLVMAISPLIPALQTIGIIGMGADLHKEITKADMKTSVAVNFEKAYESTTLALKNLDIEIKESKQNEKKDGAVITGKTPKHNIKIVLAKVTNTTTQIGIWTSRDMEFATLIVDEINKSATLAKK